MAKSDQTPNTPDTPASSGSTQTSGGTPQRSGRTQAGTLSRRDPFGSVFAGSPFGSLFQRWNEEMDRVFEDFGFGRGRLARGAEATQWSPQIEMLQRGNDLVVRADLPGLTKEDIHVDIADDTLTIRGERRQEQEEEREGWYRSERSYGSFYRSVPLPEGAIADSAKASFKDGVLEITLQAPPREVSRGRKVNVD